MIGESPWGVGGEERGKEGGGSPLHTQNFPTIPDQYNILGDGM